MIKIPYGISHFPDLPLEGYHYVDRTPYVEKLEQRNEKTILFIRPRRFGKSLFVSMLHYYYGLEHQAIFKKIFSKYYIGQHPTKNANQYLVLNLDFSGIDTSNNENIQQDFLYSVQESALNFMAAYKTYFDEKDVTDIQSYDKPNNLIRALLNKVRRKAEGKKVYILIDEYDHFANELLAFNFGHFKKIVSRNGWVRKFYEVLKIASKQGIVDRMFITGISPMTLDNMTTGFNISSNFSVDLEFNAMMGFSETEVIEILKGVGIPLESLEEVLQDLKFWYNGYMFHEDANQRIYNPDMVNYFATFYAQYHKYPKDLLDENIASDYGKMRQLFKINNSQTLNHRIIQEVIEKEEVWADLTKKYNFDRPWTGDDFISLLFYTGILTIKSSKLGRTIFTIPNYVIRQLYFQFFYNLTITQAKLSPQQLNLKAKMQDLAEYNELQAIIELAQNIMTQLGREDKAHFNETSLKTLFLAFFFQVPYYNIFSELEVQKGKTQKGRVDVLLTRRPPFEPTYQFVFELKYLRKSQQSSFEKIKKEGMEQFKKYLKYDDTLKKLDKLKAYLIIFVDNEGHFFEV